MNVLQNVLRIIYPDLCFACRELALPGEVLCLSCLGTIKPVASRLLPLRKRQTLAVHALGAYDGALHKLVVAKFRRSFPTAQAAGRIMAQLLPEDVTDVDYIVPVPLHWWRYANRGYNQAVEMAKAMSQELNIPYRPLLMRRKFTKFQYLLSRDDRHSNVADVFALRKDAADVVVGARILLIDDLCTTGVTLQAAANTLQQLQPSTIIAAVCARAIGQSRSSHFL